MTTEDDRRKVARRAAELLQQSVDGITAAAESIEQATGERIIRRRPHIFDAHRRDLEVLRTQAQAWLTVMTLVDQLLPPGDQRTLGDLVKVLPRDQLTELRHALRLAGALQDGGQTP